VIAENTGYSIDRVRHLLDDKYKSESHAERGKLAVITTANKSSSPSVVRKGELPQTFERFLQTYAEALKKVPDSPINQSTCDNGSVSLLKIYRNLNSLK